MIRLITCYWQEFVLWK